MRVRLQIGKDRKLRDRHGKVYGEVVSMSVDIDLAAFADGGKGADVEVDPPGLTLDVNDGAQTTLVARATREKFDPAFEVWAHYVQVMKPRDAGLHAQERKLINAALKVATIDECKRAIDGCYASDFHMKRNGKGASRKYNRISDILKGKQGKKTTREQIDMFLEIAERSGVKSGVASVDPGRLRAAKRDVWDAQEFPGDARIVERAQVARQWLAEQGYGIDQQGEQITFVPPATP